MKLIKKFSTAEKKKIREAVINELERYRLYKMTAFVRKEVIITPSYEPRYHGNTNKKTDQTAKAAVYNVDEQKRREAYCERMERAIERLPPIERLLIQKRYTSEDSQYMTDIKMANFVMDPPVSLPTLSRIRDSAMHKLALYLGIDCGVDMDLG